MQTNDASSKLAYLFSAVLLHRQRLRIINKQRSVTTAQRHEFESGRRCRKHLTPPWVCAKDVFLHLHYSVWQLTGSCPDVPAVSSLLSVKQCSQTSTMQTTWCYLHRIQEGGRQNSNVSTMLQPPWVCTPRGWRQNCITSVTVHLLNQFPLTDISWRSLTSLSIWAALLTPLASVYSRQVWGKFTPPQKKKFEIPPKKKFWRNTVTKSEKFGKIIKIVAFRCVS